MRQFEVYPNPSPRSRERIPLVVVVQSHLFASHTTLAAPIIPQDGPLGIHRTSIEVSVGGDSYIVLVGELAALETRQLQRPVADLTSYEDEFRRALERLFTGF